MSRILLLANHSMSIYNFRLELVERLLKDGHKVIISTPYGKEIDKLTEIGCEYHSIEISRHGTNPFKDLKLLNSYKRLIKEVKPDIYALSALMIGAVLILLILSNVAESKGKKQEAGK